MHPELVDELTMETKTKIVFYILDGVGGLPIEEAHKLEHAFSIKLIKK